ncbi:hypothetical protein VTN77DRAFT_8180 [Rasamsonia byssochlamydoides]|uniref:uncharacterized protein n=1 Tax=Rasamsonia byssochlamydoides TaxID=89139 RepID=UPI003741F1BC
MGRPDPFCIACGALISFEEVFGYRRWSVDFKPELDSKNPMIWSRLYRVIFRPEPSSPYQLSGVGRWDTFAQEFLNAPWERDAIPVDLPQLDYLKDGGKSSERNPCGQLHQFDE